jgi:MFS family permease
MAQHVDTAVRGAMTPIPHAALVRDGIPEAHYRLRWWTLVVLTLSLVLMVMESASLNVAMPTLVRELGASDTQLQWTVDLYTLVFGALLLTMGAVGDRFGRKGARSRPASRSSDSRASPRRFWPGTAPSSSPAAR